MPFSKPVPLRYFKSQIRGECFDHSGPLYNSPQVLKGMKLSDELYTLAIAGIWGIGYCPTGRHYNYWTLPLYEYRINSTLPEYLQVNYKIAVDNLSDLL